MEARGLGLQCGVLGQSNPTTERQGMVALLRPSKVAEATELNKSMAVWFRGEPLLGITNSWGGEAEHSYSPGNGGSRRYSNIRLRRVGLRTLEPV